MMPHGGIRQAPPRGQQSLWPWGLSAHGPFLIPFASLGVGVDWGEGLLGRAQAGASAGLLSPPSCPQAASVLLSQGGRSLGRGLPLLTGSSQAARVLLPEGSLTVNLHRGGVGGRFVGEGSEEQVLESHKFCHLRPAAGTGLGSPSLPQAQDHPAQLPSPCHP